MKTETKKTLRYFLTSEIVRGEPWWWVSERMDWGEIRKLGEGFYDRRDAQALMRNCWEEDSLQWEE